MTRVKGSLETMSDSRGSVAGGLRAADATSANGYDSGYASDSIAIGCPIGATSQMPT
jgi:hypothetical protein